MFQRHTQKKRWGGALNLVIFRLFNFIKVISHLLFAMIKRIIRMKLYCQSKNVVENLDDLSRSWYCRCSGERSSTSLISKGLIVSLRQSNLQKVVREKELLGSSILAKKNSGRVREGRESSGQIILKGHNNRAFLSFHAC